ADVPSEFVENPSWEVPEQVFAEEGKLEFQLQGEWLMVIMIRKGKVMNPNQEFQDYDEF
ncbi:hypothetical protein U9M48_008647, partial [Paspalum notatum var. saurae]